MGSKGGAFCFFRAPGILPAFRSGDAGFVCLFYFCGCFFFGKFCLDVFDEKGILEVSDWMVLCSEEGIEDPEGGVDFWPSHFFEAEIQPDAFSVFYGLVDEVPFAGVEFWDGGVDVVGSELFVSVPGFDHVCGDVFYQVFRLCEEFWVGEEFFS